jgi:2-oxoglutarate ferredoxin oxidoreductase subunit alpha
MRPMEWDPETGLSPRIVPGQKGGEFTATGLAHDQNSCVSYDPAMNQHSSEMRSRKLAVLQSTLSPPEVCGPESGELLLVGWGSTRGAIEEAAEKCRANGLSVSSVNLTFLSPMEPGITEIFKRFKKVMAIEINYSDDPNAPYITEENRRRGQLTMLLRSTTLVDVDCWTRVLGQPLSPGDIIEVIEKKLSEETKS